MKKFFAAALAIAAMVAATAPADACNPKTDPSCNRGVPTLNGPLACDPKVDPSCNRDVPTLNGPLACNPKTDPGCDN